MDVGDVRRSLDTFLSPGVMEAEPSLQVHPSFWWFCSAVSLEELTMS